MKKVFGKWLLRLMGWRVGPAGDDVARCVICVAPHTSNIDFVIGKLFYFAIGKQAAFLMKKVDEWKRGFYYIALKAGVPIQLGYIDYVKKEVGIMETFRPTGDAEADIRYIRSCYEGISAHHSERFN